MSDRKYNVFVYGTLKYGFYNHFLLAGIPRRPAYINGFKMYEGPGYPYAVPGDGIIYGEVYSIDSSTLSSLDCLEGYPNHYTRAEYDVDIVHDDMTDKIKAWVYYLKVLYCELDLIEDGVWR